MPRFETSGKSGEQRGICVWQNGTGIAAACEGNRSTLSCETRLGIPSPFVPDGRMEADGLSPNSLHRLPPVRPPLAALRQMRKG